MEWPNKETSFSLCISKKCDTSAAMCSYVMGAMCGEEPWFLRSRAYTGRFRSDMNALINEFQLRFEPLMEIYLLQERGDEGRTSNLQKSVQNNQRFFRFVAIRWDL